MSISDCAALKIICNSCKSSSSQRDLSIGSDLEVPVIAEVRQSGTEAEACDAKSICSGNRRDHSRSWKVRLILCIIKGLARRDIRRSSINSANSSNFIQGHVYSS